MTSINPGPWFDDLRKTLRETGGPADPAPLSLERYELLGPLGQGGAATVYGARDRQLERDVAIKVLHDPAAASPTVRDRFLREGRISAGISHPNVASLFDVGESGGRLYLVMERIDGPSLNALIQDDTWTLDRRIRFLEKVTQGVAAAHDRGVVHRDLKPGNILVDKGGDPKVVDFGLAHVIGAEASITRTGTVMGTPLYMAPEQVRGDGRAISPRTDVYALGAILYQMLTGRPPHTGETVTEIYGKIVGEEPLPPHRLGSRAARDLETIALKALDKDPARRYENAREFGEDLRRHLAGEAIQARPPGTGARISKWIRRHRVASAVLPLVIAIAVGSVLTLSAWKRREANDLAARNLVDQASDHIERGSFDLAIAAADRAIELSPTLSGAYVNRGEARRKLGDLDGALKDYDRAIELDPTLYKAYCDRAIAKDSKGDSAGAIEDATRAIGIDPAAALAYNARADSLRRTKRYAEAVADCTEAIRRDPGYFWAYLNRGLARQRVGALAGAASDFRKVLELTAPGWPERGHVEQWLGETLREIERQ